MIFAVAVALGAPDIVNPRTAGGWVSDMAGVIAEGDERALNARLQALHDDTDAELVVVTVAATAPETPRDFATALFNEWGVGDREANNGLLVLLVMDERRIEMEVGYGLEGVLSDGWLGQVRETEMVPRFKAGAYGAGLIAGVTTVEAELRAHADEVREGTRGAIPVQGGRNGPSAAAAGVSLVSLGLLCFGIAVLLTLGYLGFAAWRGYKRKQRTCPDCNVYMPMLDEAADDAHLTPGQIAEEQVGSVDWQVHQCPECQKVRTFEVGAWFSSYTRCPRCKHRTRSSRSTTVRYATEYSGGLVEVTESCAHCSHHRQYRRSTPRLPRVVVSSDHGGGGFGGGGGFSGGGGFGGGGGGSFGGGSSGGGGGGSSW
ncbi:MAG: TPM domain-containing protein [Myxococcota bacterium]